MKSILITFGLLATVFCFAQTTKNTTLNSTANSTANSTQTNAASTTTPATNTATDKAATVLFAAGKAELSAGAKENIKALLAQKMPYYEVSGYSDAHGDSLKNVLLSQTRAKAVADFLATQGVDNQTVIVNYFGASRAKSKNVKNPNDRKVEIIAFSKLLASWKEMAEKPQIFMIFNKRDTVLTGKKGTIINLPANCLSGDPTKPIKMVLKEYYGHYDMLMNNMATLADGKLLESSGMLFLAAEQNGKPLTATKPLTYQFPNQDKNGNTDYNLYKGVKTATGVNWKLADKKTDAKANLDAFGIASNRDGAMGTGEARGQQGLTADMSGFIINIGGFEVDIADCEGKRAAGSKGMAPAHFVEFSNQIYSKEYDRTAKYAISCTENEKLDTREMGGLFYQYANQRFSALFYAALTGKIKLEFHLNEDCIIDKSNILSENKYADSILRATIQDWKKTNYFKKAYKYKNKTISIHLLDKQLACNEAYKYMQLIKKREDSITNQKMIAIENNAKIEIDDKAMNTYFKYVAQTLGYINCDRFANMPNLTTLVIKANIENNTKPTIQIILKNRKTMIMAYCIKDDNGRFEVKGVPRDEPVYVIALTDKDGKAYMDIKETTVGSAPVTMNTTLATPARLKQMRELLQ